MLQKVSKKIKGNIKIYKQDIKLKGLYWSLVHRLYKLPQGKFLLSPIINTLKPDYLIFENHKLYINKWDPVVSQELLVSGKWEEYEAEIFKKNIKKNDVVLDIGAHIGTYTLIAAKIVGNKGRVYAFEPDSINFTLLKKNVEENGYKNVVLINKAVSDKDSEQELFISKENAGDHRIYNPGDQRSSIKIKTVTLDSFFKNKSKTINLIKMDIQGSEFSALTGAKKMIKENKNIKILSEFWPKGLELSGSSAKEYAELLVKNNFKIYEINENNEKTTLVGLKTLLTPIKSKIHDYKYLLCVKR